MTDTELHTDLIIQHVRIMRGAIERAVTASPLEAIAGIADYFEDCGADDPDTRVLLDRFWEMRRRAQSSQAGAIGVEIDNYADMDD